MFAFNNFVAFWNQLVTGLANFWDWSEQFQKTANELFAPGSLPLWQLAALINSVLAVVLFFAAKEVLIRMDSKDPWPEKVVIKGYRSMAFVRTSLSVYTIGCTIYILVPNVEWSNVLVIAPCCRAETVREAMGVAARSI